APPRDRGRGRSDRDHDRPAEGDDRRLCRSAGTPDHDAARAGRRGRRRRRPVRPGRGPIPRDPRRDQAVPRAGCRPHADTAAPAEGDDPMSQDEHFLYDPTAEPRILATGLAPRLASLEGKRVGILDNSKANAGTLMLAVAERLRDLYGVRDVVKREKGIAGAPSPDILAALTTCDFVLVGSAD